MAGDPDAPQGRASPRARAIRKTEKESPMPKDEWGKKRVCPTTGKRFYDLNRTPIVSPYTGQVVNIDMGRSRTMIADAEDAQTKRLKVGEEDDLLLDDDAVEDDADLGDEVLEDDEDEEVSFEDLGGVAGDDE
jgi:hypothetical protein